jgi:4-hydroxy-4-methyl-2-oxoglutarate aldolase
VAAATSTGAHLHGAADHMGNKMIEAKDLERLRGVESGMISDCMMRLGLSGWMDGLRPVRVGECRAVGRARTLLWGPKRGEGAWPRSMYGTIGSLQAGDVLVMASSSPTENLMGDNVATMAQLQGLAAVVTDSPVRDSTGIAKLSMPVFSRGPAVRLPLNLEPVALDVPITCAGAQVRPGDVVVGNEDGVLVVPAARIRDLLYQLEDVEKVESDLQRAIASRASIPEIESIIKRKKTLRQ